MSARPKARHVGKVCKCGLAYRDHANAMVNRCMPPMTAPAPQEKGAEEPDPLCRRCHKPGDCSCNVGEYVPGRKPATVPLPLSLVERAVEVFGAVEFSALGGRRCPVCSGWNMSENGETDRVHTKDCALRSVLAELRTYVGDGGKRGE